MRARLRALLLSACLALPGCEAQPPQVGKAMTLGHESARAADRTLRVALARSQLRGELGKAFERPGRIQEQACPDGEMAIVAKTPEERTLSLAVREGRWEAKSLVPIKVTDTVTVPNLAALETKLAGVDAGAVVADALDDAVVELAAHRQRRYTGVFHIIDWAEPKLIHKLGKRKPEWLAGRVQAMFVIHDAASQTALCQTRVFIANDVKEAPLTARLRSDTRDALVAELGERLQAEAGPAVARLTRVLTLPDDPRLALR